MHKNALFLHKILIFFPGKDHSPLSRSYLYPFAPYSKILDLPLILCPFVRIVSLR